MIWISKNDLDIQTSESHLWISAKIYVISRYLWIKIDIHRNLWIVIIPLIDIYIWEFAPTLAHPLHRFQNAASAQRVLHIQLLPVIKNSSTPCLLWLSHSRQQHTHMLLIACMLILRLLLVALIIELKIVLTPVIKNALTQANNLLLLLLLLLCAPGASRLMFE